MQVLSKAQAREAYDTLARWWRSTPNAFNSPMDSRGLVEQTGQWIAELRGRQ